MSRQSHSFAQTSTPLHGQSTCFEHSRDFISTQQARDELSHGFGPTNQIIQSSETCDSSNPETNYTSLRSVTQTPRTVVSTSGRRSRAASSIATTESQNLICALSAAREGVSPLVGIALADLATGEVILSQINDNQTYFKTTHDLQVHCPSRILLVASACLPNKKSTLYSVIEDILPSVTLVPVDRRMWSEEQGQEYIRDLAFENEIESIRHAIHGNYYATSAFAALMTYINTEMGTRFVSHSLRIRYQAPEGNMMIDIPAIESLELLKNLRDPRSKESLFGLLNHTRTPMGARFLRKSILQPSTQQGLGMCIDQRLNAVEELSTSEELFNSVRIALADFKDIERVLTKLVIIQSESTMSEAETVIDRILLVKSFVQAIPHLYEALKNATGNLLVKIREFCRPEVTDPIEEGISRNFEQDARLASTPLDRRNQRTFAVKSGVSGRLDIARESYKDVNEEVHKHVEDLNRDLGIHALLKYDNGRGYWLLVKGFDSEDSGNIPEELTYRVMKKGKLECQTLTLRKLNERLRVTSHEVLEASDGVVASLQEFLRGEIPHLFHVSEAVAMLDMLASFAHVATTRGYIRPGFDNTLGLKAARHPILDRTMGNKLVPNDFYATENHCFHVVTGCNMSGKSTYLRTITLLQIMAQIGCFVPAEYAIFRIIDKIFARVSLDDNLEENMSTFSVEMRDMAFITQNIDEHSLAIIDELGRGTSMDDGLGIAIALSEALINSKALVWFATHFIDLAKILNDRIGVLNLHLITESGMTPDNNTHTRMLFKVAGGTVQDESYGIALARSVGFPARFIAVAERVSRGLSELRAERMRGSRSRKLQRRRKLMLNLHDTLRQISQSDQGPRRQQDFLIRLQKEFVLRMDALENKDEATGGSENQGQNEEGK